MHLELNKLDKHEAAGRSINYLWTLVGPGTAHFI